MLATQQDAIEVTDGVTAQFYLADGVVVVDATLPDGRTVTGEIPASEFVGEDGHWHEDTIITFMAYFCGLLRFQPLLAQFIEEAQS